jgi:hypothetical protein
VAKVKNVSPFGDLYVPALGIEIKSGETVEVPDELAANMLEQPFNWSAGDSTKTTSTPEPVATADIQEENN